MGGGYTHTSGYGALKLTLKKKDLNDVYCIAVDIVGYEHLLFLSCVLVLLLQMPQNVILLLYLPSAKYLF